MALSVGVDVARSSLAVASEQIALVSRNIARAGDPDATRKTARVVTGPGSNVHISRIDRSANPLLLESYLNSNSTNQSQTAVTTALDRLQMTVDDTDLERSPAALIAKLGSALQTYSGSPQDPAVAASVVTVAKDLAATLNSASATVTDVRRQADTDIGASVDRINGYLGQVKDLNSQIVKGTQSGADVTDLLDQRDAVLKQLSSDISIRTVARENNDVAIYTDSGVTLFDKIPRSVTFQANPLLSGTAPGAAVYADGVPIAGTPHSLAIGGGALAGLVSIRDSVAPHYQTQLDEMARGLIETFAEYDQSASPTLPPAAGLFTYSGGPGLPATGTSIAGLAGDIKVNANVDPSQGGNANLLRDGGISNPSNPAYKYNTTGAAAFTDRIQQLIDALETARPFDPDAQLPATASVSSYAKASVSWLEALRQSAQSDSTYKKAVSDRAASALSKETGVNLDEEMTRLLDLERTFQASSRLISTVDSMMQTLLEALT